VPPLNQRIGRVRATLTPYSPGTRLAHRQAQGDLEQGRKVGVYEITDPIGEGGMGQVSSQIFSTISSGWRRSNFAALSF
jgi:hypothetical protein